MAYFKLLTHDYRSPLQGGKPIFSGRCPCVLPKVELDTSSKECAAGWHFVEDLANGFRIAGLWPGGRPSTAWVCEPSSDVIQRDFKLRASQLTLLRPATEDEIHDAIVRLHSSIPLVIPEVEAWRLALSRPERSKRKIKRNLNIALKTRQLKWVLKETTMLREARATWAARSAWAMWAAEEARAAWWAVRVIGQSWEAQTAWAERPWAARNTTWIEREARASCAARAALTLFTAVTYFDLTGYAANHLTRGLRDAYYYGLDMTMPISDDNTLGWRAVKGRG